VDIGEISQAWQVLRSPYVSSLIIQGYKKPYMEYITMHISHVEFLRGSPEFSVSGKPRVGLMWLKQDIYSYGEVVNPWGILYGGYQPI